MRYNRVPAEFNKGSQFLELISSQEWLFNLVYQVREQEAKPTWCNIIGQVFLNSYYLREIGLRGWVEFTDRN